jgi:hypothetical protein
MAGVGSKVRGHGWRILAGGVVLGATSFGALSIGSAAPATADDPSGGTKIVQCTSGTVTNGDVSTSSLFVAKVPTGAVHDVPGNCTVLNG